VTVSMVRTKWTRKNSEVSTQILEW
jgi:hypothetical protein